jgi:arabinofuranosyltransferase
MLPLAAWEVFSLVYYGFALPNTAYAKVFGAALPLSAAIRQGAWYFAETFSFDRVTLPAIAVAAAIGLGRSGSDRPVAAGLVLYSAYVMGIGGDFMFGRFVAAPFLCGVALLVRRASVLPSRVLALSVVAVLAAGLSSPYTPVLLSGARFAFGEVCNECNALSHHGVCDERRCYYPATGLLPQLYAQHGAAWEPHGWIANELVPLQSEVQSGHRVALVHMAGVSRYITPADVHIVDRYGLADALLARLPAKPDSRVGHYERSIPDGYFETIETGVSRIANPNVSCYYQRLRLVIAGPIWNAERFATIAEFLVGRYDGLLRPGAPVTRCDDSP